MEFIWRVTIHDLEIWRPPWRQLHPLQDDQKALAKDATSACVLGGAAGQPGSRDEDNSLASESNPYP